MKINEGGKYKRNKGSQEAMTKEIQKERKIGK
jgi:hypothetical protein